MKNFFKTNKLAILGFLILFVIPSFWFDFGKVDYGGDSNRFYFYDPASWLNNIALYFVNPLTGLGRDTANFSMIPFLIFLNFFKSVFFHSGYSLNNFFNGLLLSGGFITVHFIVKELLRKDGTVLEKDSFPAIISGLFFILSPLLVFQWERSLYSINYLFIYPLVILLFLKFLLTGKYYFLFLLPICCLIFAVNFSYATTPSSFSFFPFTFLFLFIYSVTHKIAKRFLKGFVIFVSLLFLILSFDSLVQIYNLVNPFGLSSRMLFSKEITDNRALPYFMSVQSHVRLVYNLLNQDQYVLTAGTSSPFVTTLFSFGVKFLPIFSVYPLAVCIGMILCSKDNLQLRRKTYYFLMIIFLILVFFMTSNITDLGVSIYKLLFKIPMFGMFRSFYSKFAMVYVFFYALVLGYSLTVILDNIKFSLNKKLLIGFFLILILFNGWPLVSGKMAKSTLWRSKDIPYATEIDPQYQEFIDRLKMEKNIFKFVSFPLADEDYQLLKGKTGGAYFGPSSIPILAGKNTFSGQAGFGNFRPLIEPLIKKEKFSLVKRLFSFLNIGYLFYNNDEYIYQNFSGYPYPDWFKQTFTKQKHVGQLVDSFGFNKIYSIGSFNLYKIGSEYLLPRIYVPKKIIYSPNSFEALSEVVSLEDYEIRSGVYLGNDNMPLAFADEIVINGENRDISILEIKNRISSRGVSYPPPQRKNIFQKWLFLINEKLSEIETPGDLYSMITEKLEGANRILNESTGQNQGIQHAFYDSDISQTLEMMKAIKDSDLKTEVAFTIKNNLEDNLIRIGLNKQVGLEKWQKSIESFLKKVSDCVPNVTVDKGNYLINIPKSGKYSLLADERSLKRGELLAESLKGCAFNTGEGDTEKEIKFEPKLTEAGWLDLGVYNFRQGKGKLGLNYCQLPDLIENTEWRESINLEGFTLPFAKKYYYKDIFNWEEDSWYEVKGRIKGNSKVKIAIGEDLEKWTRVHARNKLLPSRDIVKLMEINPSLNGTDFSYYVKSSSLATAAKIFIFQDNIGNKKEEGETTLEIEKASVFLKLNPRVILKSADKISDSGQKIVPKINFSRINPTKYKVKVEGAKRPYFLIFSDHFNPDWRVYLREEFNKSSEESGNNLFARIGSLAKRVTGHFLKDSLDENETTSYFEGDIKESSRKSAFLEPSTFEAWGEKAIAQTNHLLVNGYANSWYITPQDTAGREDYELILEFVPQRVFYIGLLLSASTLFFCILLFLCFFFKTEIIRRIRKI